MGIYRSEYMLEISFFDIIQKVTEKLFINDTAAFAYFSSLTHLYMLEHVDYYYVLESFFNFVLIVIFGGLGSTFFNLDLTSGYLTEAAKQYHWNVGGGIIISYLFFWFGYVFFIPVLILFFIFLLKKFKFKNTYQYLSLIIILVTIPRWYLYSPGALFRGVFVILPLVIFLFSLLNNFERKKINFFK